MSISCVSNGNGILYDSSGNEIAKCKNINVISANDVIEAANKLMNIRQYYKDKEYSCTCTFKNHPHLLYLMIGLTKRQAHLVKYGKYRTRKKWNNKMKRIIERGYR